MTASTASRAEPEPAPQETFRLLPVLLPVSAAAVTSLTAAVWTLVTSRPAPTFIVGVLVLLLAAAIAQAFPVPIEGVSSGATSLAYIFLVTAAAIYGWAAAAAAAFLTIVLVETSRRRPLVFIAYNTAVYVCAAAGAGAAAAVVSNRDLRSLVSRALLAAAAFYALDILLLALIAARSTRRPFLPSLRRYVSSTTLPLAVMASLTVSLVVLWNRSPLVAVSLVGPFVAIAFYARWVHGALDRLREIDRLKDELIAVVSHELRTPLTSVYGAAMTLEQRALDERTRESLLSIVSRESARLTRLFDDVLLASRFKAAGAQIRIDSCDATALTADVVDAARDHLAPGLSLELSCAPSPPVAADPDKLKRALRNLIDNAIKYSPDGGRIDVRLEPTNGYMQFTVKDEGLGIPANEQERIFDKFHRLDPNMTRGIGGPGLGLYICKELVERMGGRISVSSREGTGSTFAFDLPLAADFE